MYSNGGKTVVVNMKGWKWSDGETVDAQSLIFFLNMAKAEKATWYAYSAGLLPDNVVSYKATGPDQVTMQLNQAYSSLWYTYNQLSEINPMPLAWDVTALGAKPGSGGCSTDSAADGWAKCKAVYTFLTAQSKIASTYATSPLWSVVDGPWKLSSFNTDGNVTMVANKAYSGSPKPTLSAVKFVPFTSDTAEYTALKTGQVDVGYIPIEDLPQKPTNSPLPATNPLGSGYYLEPFFNYGIQYAPAELQQPAGGVPGPAALHPPGHAVRRWTSPASARRSGAGTPTPASGPVPTVPANPFVPAIQKENGGQGPYPLRSGQGHGAADQPRLGYVRRCDDLPGPGQVRRRHHQGRAAQAHVRLLDGRGRRHGDLAGHQVRGVLGRHRRHPGRPVVQLDHRRERAVRADELEVQRAGVRLRRLEPSTARAWSRPASRCSPPAPGRTRATTPTRRWTS